MKVTVKVYLNVRVGKPSINAPCFQYLAPGSVIEVEDKLYPGDKYESIDTWYRDDAWNYYWSGGMKKLVEKVRTIDFKYNENLKPSWMSGNFDVSPFWSKTTGKGITLAVIDSGIYFHEDLKDCIDYENMKSFIGDSIEDEDGHGTHVAGIIAGRGKSDIIGIAPGVKILPIKVVIKEVDEIKNRVLINAIKQAASVPLVKIINLSLTISRGGPDFEELKTTIAEIIKEKGIVFVAASGNNFGDSVLPPGEFNDVLAVSAVRKDSIIPERYSIIEEANIGDNVDTCCIGFELTSCLNTQNGKISKTGTSMATAYLSGLIALKLELLIAQGVTNIQKTVADSIKSSVSCYAIRDNDNTTKLPVIKPSTFLQ